MFSLIFLIISICIAKHLFLQSTYNVVITFVIDSINYVNFCMLYLLSLMPLEYQNCVWTKYRTIKSNILLYSQEKHIHWHTNKKIQTQEVKVTTNRSQMLELSLLHPTYIKFNHVILSSRYNPIMSQCFCTLDDHYYNKL